MRRREVLQTAAAVAAATADDVPDSETTKQQRRLVELLDRDDDERWEYSTVKNLAHVRSGLLNAQLDALCSDPTGTVRTYACRNDGVPLEFEVSTDRDQSVGTLVHLSADQAEALAVDLLEQAHAARQENDE